MTMNLWELSRILESMNIRSEMQSSANHGIHAVQSSDVTSDEITDKKGLEVMINVVKHEVNEEMSDMQGQGNLLISRVGEVWVYIAKHGVNEGCH